MTQDAELNASETGLSRGIDSFALKIIAILAMTSNHLAYIFSAHLPFAVLCPLTALGGLTFPIMAFLVTEGYRHTSNVKKYALHLFLFALVAQIPFSLFLGSVGNVLFTLLLGVGLLYLFDTLRSRLAFWASFVLVSLLGFFLDWGVLGTLMILLFYVLKDAPGRIAIPIAIAVLGLGLPQLGLFFSAFDVQCLPGILYAFVGCPLFIPLLLSYSGKRGVPLKYFFYVYYPLHIFVLGAIKFLLFND